MSQGVKNRRGDTLIEVVFALAILATILTVLTTGAVGAWRTSRAAGERTQAAAAANEQAEALRAYSKAVGWDELKAELSPGGFYMALAESDGVSQWDIRAGEASGDSLNLLLPGSTVKVMPTSAVGAEDKTVELRVTIAWKSLGVSQESTTTQLITLTEDD